MRPLSVPLYGPDYARRYEELYLDPWPDKHARNVGTVRRLLAEARSSRPSWLDLCCGQAWHFSRFGPEVERVGVDESAAQLARARARSPEARFIQGDVLTVELPSGSFDLVTSFWAAYAYLGSEERIRLLLSRAVTWTREGGALYLEVLPAESLPSFNHSEFAARTGFRVVPRTPDYTRWAYEDVAGVHEMLSPSVELFTELLRKHFDAVEAIRDGGFMTHVIARSRRAPDPSANAPGSASRADGTVRNASGESPPSKE